MGIKVKENHDYRWNQKQEILTKSSVIENIAADADKSFTAASPEITAAKKTAELAKEMVISNLQRMYHEAKEQKRADSSQDSNQNSFLFSAMLCSVFVTIIITILPSLIQIAGITAVISGICPQKNPIVEAAEHELSVSLFNIGGQKYKDWYGADDNWCAMFVTYCANECGYIEDGTMPRIASVSEMSTWYKENGQWADAGDYMPKAGDIIFFQNSASHVGIVVEADRDRGTVYTIEGNTGTSLTRPYHKGSHVKKKSYPFTHAKISGYGLPAYPGTGNY